MSIQGKRVIWAGPAGSANSKPLTAEAVATQADIKPGMVLSRSGSGFAKNANAATKFGEQNLFADKDQMRSKSVDDLWAQNENMVAIVPRSGEAANVLVITAQTLIVGSPLARSGTAGVLKLAVTPATVGATSEEIVAFAGEAVTTTATQLVAVNFA